MPWTDEDTKDVFKKVLGGLIAASVLAMAYAIVESAEWYYSATLATILVVLVIILVSRFARQSSSASDVPVVSATRHPAQEQEAPQLGGSRVTAGAEIGAGTGLAADKDKPDSEKAEKKALKAEYKMKKKDAKAREKG